MTGRLLATNVVRNMPAGSATAHPVAFAQTTTAIRIDFSTGKKTPNFRGYVSFREGTPSEDNPSVKLLMDQNSPPVRLVNTPKSTGSTSAGDLVHQQ